MTHSQRARANHLRMWRMLSGNRLNAHQRRRSEHHYRECMRIERVRERQTTLRLLPEDQA
jgi:hypothetical protein